MEDSELESCDIGFPEGATLPAGGIVYQIAGAVAGPGVQFRFVAPVWGEGALVYCVVFVTYDWRSTAEIVTPLWKNQPAYLSHAVWR